MIFSLQGHKDHYQINYELEIITLAAEQKYLNHYRFSLI